MNTINIGMVGHNFMGKAHSHAWRTAPRFFDLPLAPRMRALAGRDAERVNAAAANLGWETIETDWRRLIERDDIDLIDICVPGHLHAEIATAALEAGKHVLCEKPLANTVDEAEHMVTAATAAQTQGVFAMCGFSYRRTPALTLAKQLVDTGALGPLRHLRAQYLQDWLTDENTPLTWRLDKTKSGSGSLGDIGAHIIDAAQWITGSNLTGVSALLTTFVTDRPTGGDLVGLGGTGGADGPRGPVTVDDAAMFTARFANGAVGVFEATRFALGRKNAMRLELNGSKASLAFDFEDMNSLWFYDAADEPNAGFRRIQATEPEHPYTGNWWPVGHGLGYEHAFTHQAVDFIEAISRGEAPSPSFAEALQVQRVLEAVEASADNESRWTAI